MTRTWVSRVVVHVVIRRLETTRNGSNRTLDGANRSQNPRKRSRLNCPEPAWGTVDPRDGRVSARGPGTGGPGDHCARVPAHRRRAAEADMNDSLADRYVFTADVVFMVSALTATQLFGGDNEPNNCSYKRDHHAQQHLHPRSSQPP